MTPHDLRDADAAAARLARAGMAQTAARRHGAHIAECARVLCEAAAAVSEGATGSHCATSAWFVPGRIEVLGKHTDYAGGRSLLSAVERGFCIVAIPRPDDRVVLHDVAGAARLVLAADGALAAAPGSAAPPRADAGPAWTVYPRTVVARLARDFPGARAGADIAFISDLPQAAGLSSSSAFVTAVFLALAGVRGLDATAAYRSHIAGREDLADYLGAVENGGPFRTLPGGSGVGTRGGSEDHVALLCARPASLVQYAFRPVRFERTVPLPHDHVFVVAACGVAAEKSGAALAAYNRVADLASELERLWRTHAGASGSGRATVKAGARGRDVAEQVESEQVEAARHSGGRDEAALGTLLASAPDAYDRLRGIVERHAPVESRAVLSRRLEQFAAETFEIIPAAADALARGDIAGFGAQVDRSHDLAERLLGNQVPETMHLFRSARRFGAVAASAFGAGFGGSVWALVRAAEAEPFVGEWRADYVRGFPDRARAADFFIAAAGGGAVRID